MKIGGDDLEKVVLKALVQLRSLIDAGLVSLPALLSVQLENVAGVALTRPEGRPSEGVFDQSPIAPEPEPIFNREPIAARPADPWAVEYGGGHQVVPPEPSMVGYTAPFADAPVEPIGLSKSAMSPDIEPLDQHAEPAEQGIDTSYEPLLHTASAEEEEEEETPLVMRTRTDDEDLARVSDALDLQLDDTPESAGEDLSLDADEPVLEISARDVLPERESHAISIEDVPEEAWQSDRAPREVEEPAPVAASPSARRSKSGSSSSVLRLMPLAGGTPKVIAYVYGGQGTINVPSWSPDGKMLAFVSNTGGL